MAAGSSGSGMQLDELFQRLKEHDSDWLAQTLYERWVHLIHANKEALDKTRSVSNQSSVWPFDVTLPYLPDSLQVSEYVHFIRSFDWAATEFGPMSSWSLDFRRTVNICLCEKRATAFWKAPNHAGFYNEAYAVLAGQKHPHSLGKPFGEMWPEPGISEFFDDMFDAGEKHGRSSMGDDMAFILERHGRREEIWASFNIVPLADAAGGIFGCYNTCFETTSARIQGRRLTTMILLGQSTALATNVQDFWQQLLHACEPNTADVPFAAIYSLDPVAATALPSKVAAMPGSFESALCECLRTWTLAGSIGLVQEEGVLPTRIDCVQGAEFFSDGFKVALATTQPTLLTKKDGTFPSALDGIARSRAYGDKCDSCVLFPISPTNRESTPGFMILGINPLVRYDADYQQFLELFIRQCATSLAAVVLVEEEMKAAKLAAQDRVKLSTQLAETRQEVLDRETRFRTMADMAPVAMFHLDQEGRIIYANQNWLDLTQHSKASTDRQSWMDLVHRDDKELVDKEWAKLLKGSSVSFEMRWERAYVPEEQEYVGGELVGGATWTLASAYAEKHRDGSVRGILGCLTDISRQKWMESFQDRRMKELVELKRQQENFMDLVSHEARNPLSAIMLCAESMIGSFKILHDLPGDPVSVSRADAESHLEGADIIMACAQHQKRIIDDVLTLSKLDSGLLIICPIEVQPSHSISQALKMFDGEVHKHGIDLSFIIDPSYHDLEVNWVKLDPSRVLQVLINLLTNAIKFTQSEPVKRISVTLSASSTRPTKSLNGVEYFSNDWPSRSTDENIFIGLEVVDTGRGITPDEMKRLFQKFQQASPKTHVEYGGSGLGLFISRQLTRMQGGAIGVASAVATGGTGATFAFYIAAPRCSAPIVGRRKDSAQSHAQPAVSTVSSDASEVEVRGRRPSANEIAIALIDESVNAKKHILIVEDNLVNQRVMRNQLERLKYSVAVANHGLEALDHIRQTHFCKPNGLPLRLMLLDVEMPVCNGLECAKRIRQMQQTGEINGHIPIVGVTANARAEQQTAALDAGMDAVVTKPFRLMELSAELDKIDARFHS